MNGVLVLKKRFFGIMVTFVLLLLAAGCQSSAGGPADTVDKVVDSIFYRVDSDIAYNNLGMTSAETRDYLFALTEYDFQSQFFPTAEEEVSDENGEVSEVVEATDAETGEEAAEEEFVVDPDISALAARIMDIMQITVKYKTKLMMVSNNAANVKLTVYPYDISAFYSEYYSNIMAIEAPGEEATDEEKDNYTRLSIDAYSSAVGNAKASSEGYDLYIDLYKSDGNWYISGIDSLFYDLYYLYSGTFY